MIIALMLIVLSLVVQWTVLAILGFTTDGWGWMAGVAIPMLAIDGAILWQFVRWAREGVEG